MYVIMDSHLMPAGSRTQPDMSMPGMDVSAMNMPASNSAIWSSAVGWFGAVGFTAAAIFWTGGGHGDLLPRHAISDLSA
jgi:hypothetical protein